MIYVVRVTTTVVVADKSHCHTSCGHLMARTNICLLHQEALLEDPAAESQDGRFLRCKDCVKRTLKPLDEHGNQMDPYTEEAMNRHTNFLKKAGINLPKPSPLCGPKCPGIQFKKVCEHRREEKTCTITLEEKKKPTKPTGPSPNCTPGCAGIGNSIYCGLQRRTRHCVILLPEQKPEKPSPRCPDDCPGVKNPLDCHSIKSCYKCKPVKKKKPILQKISAKCKRTCLGVPDPQICRNMRASHNCPVPSLREKPQRTHCLSCGASYAVVTPSGKCLLCGKNPKLKKK